MFVDRTKEMSVAGSIAKRTVRLTRMGTGLAFATALFLAAPQSALADEDVDLLPPPEPKYHSKAQRVTGGVLIASGVVSLVGAGAALAVATYDSQSDGSIVVIALVALPLLVQGLAVEAVGIPLFINGSKPATSARAGVNPSAPMALSIRVGPQSASLKLTF